MYENPSASCKRSPDADATTIGNCCMLLHERTGELTPPGMTVQRFLKISSERGLLFVEDALQEEGTHLVFMRVSVDFDVDLALSLC